MNASPKKKFSAELTGLTKVDSKKLQPGKFYYIRIRNKDQAANIWGIKEDFIGKINRIDDAGVSFDFTYKRNADPRHGASVWKKASGDNRVFVFGESLKHKNLEDNTTFYIDEKYAGKTRKNGWMFNIKKLFGKTRKAAKC